MFKQGLTIEATSAVGSIRRNMSSIGLYACGDLSNVFGQMEVGNIPSMDFSNTVISIFPGPVWRGIISISVSFTDADGNAVTHIKRQAEIFSF